MEEMKSDEKRGRRMDGEDDEGGREDREEAENVVAGSVTLTEGAEE